MEKRHVKISTNYAQIYSSLKKKEVEVDKNKKVVPIRFGSLIDASDMETKKVQSRPQKKPFELLEYVTKGQGMRILVIHTTDHHEAKGILDQFQPDSYALVQKISDGYVKISYLPQFRNCANNLIRILRIEEQHLEKVEYPIMDISILTKEGIVEGIPEWDFFPDSCLIINGSSRTNLAKPTNIKFQKIVEWVTRIFPVFVCVDETRSCELGRCPISKYGIIECNPRKVEKREEIDLIRKNRKQKGWVKIGKK